MRKIFPEHAVVPDIESRRNLRKVCKVENACAKRLWRCKVLSLIWMDADEIQSLHFSELDTKYWSYGLDIVEMRAVYACLPKEFPAEFDLDGKKEEWLRNFRDVLVDLSAEEQAGTLNDARARHFCYRPAEGEGQGLSEHERILLNFFEKHEPTYANIKKVRQLSNFFKARVERDDKAALAGSGKSGSGGGSTSAVGESLRRGGSAVAQYRSLFAAVSHEGRTQQEVAAERRKLLAQERVWRTVMYDEFTEYYRADPRRVWQFSRTAHAHKQRYRGTTLEDVGSDAGSVADSVIRQHGLLRQSSKSPKTRQQKHARRLVIFNQVFGEADDDDGETEEAVRTREVGSIEFATAAFGATKGDFTQQAAICAEPLLGDQPLLNADEVAGKLAVVLRGGVSFVTKARHAEAAGACGVIFVNTDEELFTVGGEEGDEDVSIPVVGVRASDGQVLLQSVAVGGAIHTEGLGLIHTVSLSFDRDADAEAEESSSSDSEDEDEGYASGGSDWDADRLAALIPSGTRDQLLDEMRMAARALGMDAQRPAGSDAWDQWVEEKGREFAKIAGVKRAERELQERVRSGEGVERFAGGSGSPVRRGRGSPQVRVKGNGGGARQRGQRLGDRIREAEMDEVERSTKVTLAGGVGKAKQKFGKITRAICHCL